MNRSHKGCVCVCVWLRHCESSVCECQDWVNRALKDHLLQVPKHGLTQGYDSLNNKWPLTPPCVLGNNTRSTVERNKLTLMSSVLVRKVYHEFGSKWVKSNRWRRITTRFLCFLQRKWDCVTQVLSSCTCCKVNMKSHISFQILRFCHTTCGKKNKPWLHGIITHTWEMQHVKEKLQFLYLPMWLWK